MIKFSFLIRRLPGMSFEDFVRHHKEKHGPLFMSIPESQQYVRKYIITHAITFAGFPEPIYDGINEIWFDSFDDFKTFFATKNYLEKVHPDEGNFIDLDNVVVMITNETIMK